MVEKKTNALSTKTKGQFSSEHQKKENKWPQAKDKITFSSHSSFPFFPNIKLPQYSLGIPPQKPPTGPPSLTLKPVQFFKVSPIYNLQSVRALQSL